MRTSTNTFCASNWFLAAPEKFGIPAENQQNLGTGSRITEFGNFTKLARLKARLASTCRHVYINCTYSQVDLLVHYTHLLTHTVMHV